MMTEREEFKAETVKTIDAIKAEMVKRYSSLIVGAQPFIKTSMLLAYQKGLDDALDWVKRYNLEYATEKKVILES